MHSVTILQCPNNNHVVQEDPPQNNLQWLTQYLAGYGAKIWIALHQMVNFEWLRFNEMDFFITFSRFKWNIAGNSKILENNPLSNLSCYRRITCFNDTPSMKNRLLRVVYLEKSFLGMSWGATLLTKLTLGCFQVLSYLPNKLILQPTKLKAARWEKPTQCEWLIDQPV